MSEASRDLVVPTVQKEVGPNYFGYYKREILELFSQDEDFLSPFSSLAEEIAGQSFNGKENNSFTSSNSLFTKAIGAKLSEFKRERLKASLRQSVTTLTQEVDELLDPVVAMCQIQSHLRDKKHISTHSSMSDGNVKQPPCKRQRTSSPLSSSSIAVNDESFSCSSTSEDSGSEDMKSKFIGAGSSEESKFSTFNKRCADCQTTKTPQWRDGPAGPKSLCNACGIRYKKQNESLFCLNKGGEEKKESGKANNDLEILLQTGGLQVQETVKRYSDELAATLGNMEQHLEELLDIVMSKCRPMTLIEKQQLKKLIQKLPPKNLDRVVEIIQRSKQSEMHPCDEIHVDLEKEDNVTLWRLYYYLEAVANAKMLSS